MRRASAAIPEAPRQGDPTGDRTTRQRFRRWWMPLLAVTLAPALPAGAQEARVTEEVVTALHPDRGVGVLDARLRRELGLFAEVEGFVAARLLRPRGRDGWILEIERRSDGETVRERRTLTEADLSELRARISEALTTRGMGSAVEREGRGGVVLASTVLGLAYYGWAVPGALGIESDRGQVAGYLLTSGVSFLAPYMITRSHPVSRAERNGTVWGMTRGIALGAVLGDLLALDASDDARTRTIEGMGVVGSVLTGIAGHAYAGTTGNDVGRTALAGALGDFALASAFATAFALDLYEGETICEFDVCHTANAEVTFRGHAVSLGLAGAGIVAAARHARGRNVGLGDVRVLQSAGLLGIQLAAPIADAAFGDEGHDGDRAIAGTLVAGAAAGLFVGNRYGMRGELTPGDGLLVLAGHLAGGATAAGLTYLVDDDERDPTLYLATSALGSLAGSLLTYRAVRSGQPSGVDGGANGGSPAGADGGAEGGVDRTAGGHRRPTLEVQPLALLGGRAGLPVVTIRF